MEERLRQIEARLARLEAMNKKLERVAELVDIEELHYGVSRPQSWIDEHPEFIRAVENIKKSIVTEGLKHPLEIDMGNVVQRGNQRLYALRELNWKEPVACVRV